MDIILLHNAGCKFKTSLGHDIVILDTDFKVNEKSFILYKILYTNNNTLAICNNKGQAYESTGRLRRVDLDLMLIPKKYIMYTLLKGSTPSEYLKFACACYADRAQVEHLQYEYYPNSPIARIEWEN